MKVGTTYTRSYFIMVDKDNDVVQIDGQNGGQILKAPIYEFVTAWSAEPSTREITLENMRAIMNMNLGLGLRIAEMQVTFETKEIVNVVTPESKLN